MVLAIYAPACKHIQVHDDDDLDSVLLGGGDFSGDGAFDPFSENIGEGDVPDYGNSDRYDEDEQPDDAIGIIRYGRFGSEGRPEYKENNGGFVSRPRGTT